MTERTIQNALFDDLNRKGYQLACPNYTPFRWHESDLFAVTRAGMGVEFEIKISRSDFKADASKLYKHERMANADPVGPSRFFYVVPDGLITVEEVPAWAGLIYVRVWTSDYHASRIVFHEIKKAPKRHRYAVPQKVIDHMRGVFYWRFWNLRRGMAETIADCGQCADNEKAPGDEPGA
jgi:hypothetical protein